MLRRFILVSCFLLTLTCCSKKEGVNRFSDPVYVRISDYQDKRRSDSLVQYLKSTDKRYRSAACLALASVQDTTVAPVLGNLLLEDLEPEVRMLAAFALGQTGGIAAVNALIPAIEDVDPIVVRESLEALGKTIGKRDLEILSRYSPRDQARREGLSWCYYRIGLRNLANEAIALREMEFLKPTYSATTRLAAAQFFGRAKLSGLATPDALIFAAQSDSLAEVRMAAVVALRQFNPDLVLKIISQIAANDKDERVRSNAVRACAGFPARLSGSILFQALSDSAVSVRITASEYLIRQAKEISTEQLARNLTAASPTRVKANLYGALLIANPDHISVPAILELYHSAGVYDKSWLISALGHAMGKNAEPAFQFLSTEVVVSKVPVIQTSAAEALVALNRRPEFFNIHKKDFINCYRKAVEKGDPAVVGIISGALSDSTLGFRDLLPDIAFLEEAAKRFQLPRDIESLQPLSEAIAWLKHIAKPASLKNSFNHPIDWKLVQGIPADQRVVVTTNKGEIVLRLFVDEAPGSVANFVELVNRKYFDGRYFHRVVPNFVIQTGCNRGDGYGSEPYSIRSEFSNRRFREGSVGMASAGKDTEGTQWFITHSPTPHLDGRYTLFAQLESGQSVVDQTEVGDVIVSVKLKGK